MFKNLFTRCLLVACLAFAAPAFGQQLKSSLYQLTVYTLKDKAGEALLDEYLQQAYLPALHRAGISKVGVFKTADTDNNAKEAQKLYVLIPFKKDKQFLKLHQKLEKDKQYNTAAKAYWDAPAQNAPFVRYETIIMEAFAGMQGIDVPQLKAAPAERIYELRSYEAATDKLHLNKVAMFNNGEIDIFKKLGFNAIFYGRVIAGSKQPNLMYMTAFENKAARDAHWQAFGNDPDWKKLSQMPQYANNFLRADIYLLRPTSYSDL